MRSGSMLLAVLLATSAAADDLGGADKFLCSTVSRATACGVATECASLPPADLNIPQFVVVDVAAKQLSTTAASGEDRRSTVQAVRREGGQIVLQGYEQGRAFSLFIEEASGRASFASAAAGRAVLVFAACTPMR